MKARLWIFHLLHSNSDSNSSQLTYGNGIYTLRSIWQAWLLSRFLLWVRDTPTVRTSKAAADEVAPKKISATTRTTTTTTMPTKTTIDLSPFCTQGKARQGNALIRCPNAAWDRFEARKTSKLAGEMIDCGLTSVQDLPDCYLAAYSEIHLSSCVFITPLSARFWSRFLSWFWCQL